MTPTDESVGHKGPFTPGIYLKIFTYLGRDEYLLEGFQVDEGTDYYRGTGTLKQG